MVMMKLSLTCYPCCQTRTDLAAATLGHIRAGQTARTDTTDITPLPWILDWVCVLMTLCGREFAQRALMPHSGAGMSNYRVKTVPNTFCIANTACVPGCDWLLSRQVVL